MQRKPHYREQYCINNPLSPAQLKNEPFMEQYELEQWILQNGTIL